mmetsp:Transcript_31761/g.71876  ORF Transcript_31761/g.71876 Transcript_31761/m.71876 type:complete len:175 (+) Transcript_31761:207-731(+)
MGRGRGRSRGGVDPPNAQTDAPARLLSSSRCYCCLTSRPTKMTTLHEAPKRQAGARGFLSTHPTPILAVFQLALLLLQSPSSTKDNDPPVDIRRQVLGGVSVGGFLAVFQPRCYCLLSLITAAGPDSISSAWPWSSFGTPQADGLPPASSIGDAPMKYIHRTTTWSVLTRTTSI